MIKVDATSSDIVVVNRRRAVDYAGLLRSTAANFLVAFMLQIASFSRSLVRVAFSIL